MGDQAGEATGGSARAAWTARVLTLFPEMFPGPLGHLAPRPGARRRPLAARGAQHPRRGDRPPPHRRRHAGRGRGRHGAARRHRRRRPRRGGQRAAAAAWPVIYLSPRGRRFDQARARALAAGPGVTLLCGRFEGIDERVLAARGGRGGEPRGLRADRRGDRRAGLDRCQRSAYTPRPRERRVDGGGILRRPGCWSFRTIRARPNGKVCGYPRFSSRAITDGSPHWRRAEAERLTKERRPDLWRAYLAKAGQADPAGEAELSDAHTTAATGGQEKDEAP